MSRTSRLPFVAAAIICFSTIAWTQGVNIFPAPGALGTGEREMKALAAAYPDRINETARRNGDWAVDVKGQWFSWAHGRVLPESQSTDWERYAPFRFYPYPVGGLPPLPHLDADSAARLKKALEDARLHPPRRSADLLERLFDAGSVTVSFMGFPVRVNRLIAEPLTRVGAECARLRVTDQQAARFFADLSEVDVFNYRDVAGTATRSYHSFGLALDLIPRSYRGKATYWRWVMDTTDQWWAIPYAQRWMAPLSVVSAFEKQGFVWGGKWLFFDTMHFEYRPEILLLARGT